jgi:hypothetical protein
MPKNAGQSQAQQTVGNPGISFENNIKSLLVGGFNHLEKYDSQWKGLARIYMVENKKCSKPPTSLLLFSKHLFQSHLYLERWKCGAPRF